MSSYNWVTERLAVGGQIGSKEALAALSVEGVTHVIDLQAELDDNAFGDPALKILWLPWADDGSPRNPEDVRLGVAFAFNALAATSTKVLCHCAAGVNRGPTMCYAILRAFGIPKDEAIARIRAARPEVRFFNISAYVESVEAALKG